MYSSGLKPFDFIYVHSESVAIGRSGRNVIRRFLELTSSYHELIQVFIIAS